MKTVTPLSATFFVTPQLQSEDIAAIAQNGFTRIICNRPDGEGPNQPAANSMDIAAQAAGLEFHYLPFGMEGPTPQMLAEMDTLLKDDKKTLAYCASGQRSALLYGAAQLRNGQPMDQIIDMVQPMGFDNLALVEARLASWAER